MQHTRNMSEQLRILTSQLLLLLLMGLSWHVNGYPSGAPASTCWTRYPKHHGVGTRMSQSPVVVTFSSASYRPSQLVTISVEVPAQHQMRFMGLQLAAFRESGNPEEIVGQFESYPQDKLKTLNCFGGARNMITHANNMAVQRLELTWRAPGHNVGNLTFRATVVRDFNTFWTDIRATLLAYNQTAADIVAPQNRPILFGNLVQPVDFSACGADKGCFLYPSNCWEDECLAAASFQFRQATQDYLFELSSTAAQNWISLGFSYDQLMGNDETITCVADSSMINIQHGWNPRYSNERLLNRFLSEAEVRQVDGKIQCRFVLPPVTSAYSINQSSAVLEYTNVTFPKDIEWYLMLAWGKAMPASDVLSKHVEMPAVTHIKVNLKDHAIYRGSAFPTLVRLHAALMMVAWILLGGFVTVVARHYKDWMTSVRLLGTKVWFQVHRGLAVVILLLSIIGIIAVFSHYGATEIHKKSVPHSYVGLTVLVAVLVQATAGMLRPSPEHKLRVWFNWGHRFLGQATHILAAVTMFLAYDVVYFNQKLSHCGTVVLVVWLVLQILWHILFEILASRGLLQSQGSAESTKTVDKEDSNKLTIAEGDQDKADSGKDRSAKGMPSLLTILLVTYGLCLTILCVAALVVFLLF